MFALDLFNTDHERRLAEGAVDQLEQRRIDDLAMKMDDLVARAKQATTPEAKAALTKEFQKCKAERDGYFKIKDECMGYGSLGEELSGDELNQSMAQISKDAAAGVAQSINKQSDARIAALKNPPKPKGFLQQVGDKQIGMVKGAWKGLTNPGSVEEAGIGQDLVTPQQRVQQSTPQKQTTAGKAVDTAKQAAKWLAGKGGPGKEGPTYEEEELDEQGYNPTNATGKQAIGRTAPTAQAPRAFGVGNFQRLVKANMSNRPYVDLEFANPADNLRLDQKGLDLISDYYDGLENDQAKNHFIYRILPSADEVKTILTKLGWTGAAQQQLPLSEKKKFDSTKVDAGDVKVARELQKLRAQYPASKSDVEAVAHAEIDSSERSQRQLAAIKGANEKQDALLKQLVALDQEQGREIDGLDSENNSLEKRLAQVQSTNDRLQSAIGQMTGTKKTNKNKPGIKPAVEPTGQTQTPAGIDLIPNAPVDAQEPAKTKPVKKSNVIGHMAQQIAGFPTITPGDTKTDTAVTDKEVPKDAGDEENMAQQFPKMGKASNSTVAGDADEFKLTGTEESINEGQGLLRGDPVVVTAPNEFEGKTGEIYDFSPSGTFVIVDLYNHGKHSMHLSDVKYNDYADQEEADDWYDKEMDEGWYDPKSFPGAKIGPHIAGPQRTPVPQVKNQIIKSLMVAHKDLIDKYGQRDVNIVAQSEAAKAEPTPQGIQKAVNNVINFLTSGLSVNRLRQQTLEDGVAEGFQDFNKVEPYAVCLAGKPVKKFDYYEQARRFHDNWKQKLYREGNKEKADKITLMPLNLDEAGSPAQQAAIAIAMKKAGKKPKQVDEETGSWIVYDPETKQIKKRFKTHTAGKSYAKTHGLGFASSSYYFDNVKEKTVAETVTDIKSEMAKVYRRLAPKIERHRDSFLAGQLYDELENIAELHGAEAEFKRMMNGARNRAHMDYDTDPGGFQNWFWYLPFEDEVNEGLMKDPTNRKEYLDQRDKLFRMMSVESNPANKQIIKQAIQDLESRFSKAKDTVKEESSTSSEAVEIAIIKRILVAHTDLIMEFGLDKVTQAIEEVAYNVGDVDEIGTSDVSAYVAQVKQILGVEA